MQPTSSTALERIAAKVDELGLEPPGEAEVTEPRAPLPSEAVTNKTRRLTWHARIASPVARWVLPTAGRETPRPPWP